jgi:hypothetical protein
MKLRIEVFMCLALGRFMEVGLSGRWLGPFVNSDWEFPACLDLYLWRL